MEFIGLGILLMWLGIHCVMMHFLNKGLHTLANGPGELLQIPMPLLVHFVMSPISFGIAALLIWGLGFIL